jgi:hypothetical protein
MDKGVTQTAEEAVWAAEGVENSDQGHADASLQDFLHHQGLQQQPASLTSEQLAALAAAAGVGAQDPSITDSAAAAAGSVGVAQVTLPPVPDLQGTSLGYAGQPAPAAAHPGDDAAAGQLQMLDGQQQAQLQLAALTGGLGQDQQLAGVQHSGGEQQAVYALACA